VTATGTSVRVLQDGLGRTAKKRLIRVHQIRAETVEVARR
jgi:hypothetical protein